MIAEGKYLNVEATLVAATIEGTARSGITMSADPATETELSARVKAWIAQGNSPSPCQDDNAAPFLL